MISFNTINKYCCEDISLIENYNEAINSDEKYVCHHRLGIDLGLSREELIEKDLYFNRPASELIFLTNNEHTSLHNTGKKSPYYGKTRKMPDTEKVRRSKILKEYYANEEHISYHKNNKWMTDGLVEYFVIPEYWGELIDIGFYFGRKNKPHNANKHLSEYTKKKQSSTLTGAKWMNNGIERSFVMKDKIEYYINNGYVFGYNLI